MESLQLRRTEVATNEEIAPGIFRLTFPRDHDFVPGQTLALTVDPSIPARYYSIASGRRDPLIEIIYDLVPEGRLTPRLAHLGPGDHLLASEAFGAFCDEEGASLWIAAGTGVAPFASMARSGFCADKMLVHGSRTLAGLYLRGYFSSVLGARYVPCCSAEMTDGVFRGRTTAWLASASLPAAPKYLLCGSSRMVVDARDVLISRGVPFDRVVAEIYF
jgi:ferredoxin--NADP+ reductase